MLLARRPVVSILAQPEGRALPSRLIASPTSSTSFQSSPSPKAGRYAVPQRRRAARERGVSILAQPEGRALPQHGNDEPITPVTFQSSPSPKAGRYRQGLPRRRPAPDVSILAQPEGRALPRRGHGPLDPLDEVSILAQPEGRALLAGYIEYQLNQRVSILAQPEGRALQPPSRPAAASAAMFQSSPSPKAGRYPSCGSSRRWRSPRGFNPRPARRPGATRAPCARAPRWSACFNPRPARRPGATHAPAGSCRSGGNRFNPRPARRPGATRGVPGRGDVAGRVSILAQPEGRALLAPPAQGWRRPQAVLILAQPEGRALLADAHHLLDRLAAVSILAQPEGRALPAWRSRRPRRRATGFNPRPARRPGATGVVGDGPLSRPDVSILAQPEGRALPALHDVRHHAERSVSILAQPEGRALPPLGRATGRSTRCFNPRPARRPGATRRTCRGCG